MTFAQTINSNTRLVKFLRSEYSKTTYGNNWKCVNIRESYNLHSWCSEDLNDDQIRQ